MISEAVTKNQITVGAPFFNQVGTPVFLALLLLTGICPLIAWRKATGKNFRRNFFWPLLISMLGGVILWFSGIRSVYSLMAFLFSIFALYSIGMEFWKGIRAKMRSGRRTLLNAIRRLVTANQRRYGGYIIHLGVVLIFVGITGSMGFKTEQEIVLAENQQQQVGEYTLEMAGLYTTPEPEMTRFGARLNVYKDGSMYTTMRPEKRLHRGREDQPHTEIALHQTLKEDLYIIYAGTNSDDQAVFKVHINPLTAWIWIGGMVMAFGTLLALYPFGKSKKKDKKRDTQFTRKTDKTERAPADHSPQPVG